KAIEKKLKDSVALDYPEDRIEFIVASDASTDATDGIVKSFPDKRVCLVRSDVRGGKTAAQNLAVSAAKGEILLFSDATTVWEKDAVKKLVRNFKDPAVGCVGGEERFVESGSGIAKEAGFFWRYETILRQKESAIKTMIGVSGCIFAIRKCLYEKLNDRLIEDFAIPLKVASKGYRVIYEKKAIAYEDAARDTKSELIRKSRIVTGGMVVVAYMRGLLNPLKYPFLSFSIISHKIFRWLAPFFMVLLLISNLSLMRLGPGFFMFAVMQVGFYTLAFAGYILKDRGNIPGALRLAYHFCLVNLAAFLGFVKFISGEKRVIWEPVR
ncbi:MAG TPA: glycosyltransferase, partial [Candidatus Omnitrophota bacterium]|nr:glycosyltransferase [Candidatus Omnitrophota bacterium]